MRAFQLTKFLSLAGIAFAMLHPSTVSAVPVCTAGSLSTYISLDTTGGCTVGQFTFFRFTAPLPNTSGSPTVATDSQILVTPIQSGTAAGFAFTAESGETNLFSITSPSGTTAVTYFIDYSVDPAPIIGGAELNIDPPFGNVSATQTYCTADVLIDGCVLGTISQQTASNPSPLSSVVAFPNPSSFVDIDTDISLVATPGHPAGLDAVNALVDLNVVSAVPEPATLPLMALLLLPLFFLVRRKRA